MGTRADFYVRKDKQMTWLGSKAYDGYPSGIDKDVLEATTEENFVLKTESFLKGEDDATFPEEGWPWPWDDSRTTDYSYIFEGNKVMASCFGFPLFDPLIGGEDNDEVSGKMSGYFPNMSNVKNVKIGGKGSGHILVSVGSDGKVRIV